MNDRLKRRRPAAARLLALALAACLGAHAALAADTEDEGPPAAADSAQARAILKQMATFLASQKSFRVEISSAYDAMQPTGQKIEFLDKRTLTVRRPHDLRAETERSDGVKTTVVMNSDTITAQQVSQNLYAQIPAKPSLDESLAYFMRDLRMRMPLAMLLASDLPARLDKRVVQADLVEETSILGKPAHHIAGSTGNVDFQVWVGSGKEPLPYRIVLTYRDAPGQPQFRASFSDWDLSPWTMSSTFEPKIAKGAKRIAFVAQVKAAAAPVAASADQVSSAKGAAK